MYALETNNLCKSYGRFRALDGLNIHVPQGAVYGLVGKNGAGKTTLIRLICGLQSPTSGSFSIYGVPSSGKINNARARIGAVVETPSIYSDMSARDNMRMQYRILGLPSEADIDSLLTLVGLSDTGSKKAGKFSLGMRQRLGIAVALAGSPDLLILDEPINGLDPQGIIEIRELILKLNRELGITIMVSSHNLDELSRIATHYGFINEGRAVREISAQELEKACRKCMRLVVSNMSALCRVLDESGLDYMVCSPSEAEVYGQISISRLAAAMTEAGGELIAVQESEESLESYYLNLMGGAANG